MKREPQTIILDKKTVESYYHSIKNIERILAFPSFGSTPNTNEVLTSVIHQFQDLLNKYQVSFKRVTKYRLAQLTDDRPYWLHKPSNTSYDGFKVLQYCVEFHFLFWSWVEWYNVPRRLYKGSLTVQQFIDSVVSPWNTNIDEFVNTHVDIGPYLTDLGNDNITLKVY